MPEYTGANRYAIERTAFLKLVATNPNYFGNLTESPLPAVRRIVADTTYEQISGIAVHSTLHTFQVTVEVKRPTGYRGQLLDAGSTEHVRLYADFGTGWEDLGATHFRVYDDHVPSDGPDAPGMSLGYVVSLVCEPRRLEQRSGMARVRAILSWEVPPPPNNAAWCPVWGNVVDEHVWIARRTSGVPDFTEVLGPADELPIEVYVEPRLIPRGRSPFGTPLADSPVSVRQPAATPGTPLRVATPFSSAAVFVSDIS
jgi:hypothetical protein